MLILLVMGMKLLFPPSDMKIGGSIIKFNADDCTKLCPFRFIPVFVRSWGNTGILECPHGSFQHDQVLGQNIFYLIGGNVKFSGLN